MMEENLRRTLLLSQGDPAIFFTRPLSAALLVMAAVMVAVVLIPAISKKRDVVFSEEE
jgi:putative tricarboxylic transport membrane protein